MSLRRPLLIALLSLASGGAAADPFDARSAAAADLLAKAVQYANTPPRQAEKAAAREEIFARRAASLRPLLSQSHVENITLQVLILEVVDRLRGDEAVPELLPFLADERHQERRTAAYFLGWFDAPEHADRLLPLLEHEKTRGAAIRTLGKWRAREHLGRVLPFLRDGKERVRVATANALRDLGDPAALPALIAALSDPVFTVRLTAQRALVRFGAAAEAPVRAALPGAPAPARRLLIQTLGDIQATAARAELAALRADADADVRDEAARALELLLSP